MKNYKPLSIPEDTAWERFTVRKYLPYWFKCFIDGVKNLIDWSPVIYKDRHWDSSYIFEVLKRKIELQREYLVKHNRHLGVPIDNYFMTVSLNLIERMQSDFYEMEYMDYHETKYDFIPVTPDEIELDEVEDIDLKGASRLETILLSEKFDEYFSKYPRMFKKISKENPEADKQRIAFLIGRENQKRCKRLLFNILENHIERWWD